ncbi:hypothetical protein [Aeromonas veronii]|uniref:hypothetical protein n=1 Tax=Aeromonas veronii TaxID=654 RepID=UPI000E091CAA|nr:hypothetical protein [Aeromonas veronii]RDE60933.1 hypothetical protein DV708_16665 [Aeromonas veronii]
MFFKSVKAAWEAGKVKVGLPAVGHGESVTIEANGLVGFKAKFLNSDERQKLAALSKNALGVIKTMAASPVSDEVCDRCGTPGCDGSSICSCCGDLITCGSQFCIRCIGGEI